MVASSSHVPNVSITVLLQSLATPGAGFGTVTLMVDEALGNALGGARFLDFADFSEVQTSRIAGEITAEVEAAGLVAFSQQPAPPKWRICRVDTGGTETYTTALTALEAEAGVAGDLYGFCMDSRVPATQILFATTLEAKKFALLLQDNDADWKLAPDPPAWVAVTEFAKSGHVYKDADSEWLDVGAMVANLAFDPDFQSVPWERRIRGVAAEGTFITGTERNNIITNDSALLGTWGSTDFWLDNVVTFDGRPFYERLSADWFEARVSEAIQTMHQRESDAGRKVLVSQSGMAQLVSTVQGVVTTAESAQHFTPGQSVITPEAITDADRTARRLRLGVLAQIGISARLFTITANLSTTPVIV